MLREIVEELNEGKGGKFHPIDVFMSRWLITDGKTIVGTNGEVKTFKEFKKDMKNMKRHDEWDYIYFPTEKMAKEAKAELGKNFDKYQVKKVSYA